MTATNALHTGTRVWFFTGLSECSSCIDGYICKKGKLDSCPIGSFCQSGVVSTCADGTYSEKSGLTSQSECIECPSGKTCENGENNGECPAGTLCLIGATKQYLSTEAISVDFEDQPTSFWTGVNINLA